MTRFIDGPAAGQTLMLKRAPVFLRVVQGEKWDALDQPDDEPLENETVYAYQLAEAPGHVHLSTRGQNGKRGGGFYPLANYKLCEEQPTKTEMIVTGDWRAWCYRHAEQVKLELRGVEVKP